MKDYKVSVSTDKKENSTKISLQGHLGLGQMNGLRTDVLRGIKRNSSVAIQIKEVEESDLSLFQLVKSIERYCRQQNIKFKVDYELTTEQKILFAKSGIHV